MNIQQWADKHYKRKASDINYSHIRLGQAFFNFALEFFPGAFTSPTYHWPDLFYKENDKEALLIIMKWLDTKPSNYFETITEGM